MTAEELGLTGRGKLFYEQVTSEYDLTASETLLLVDAAREVMIIDRLEMTLADAPITVLGSMKQETAHPALTEVRMHRTTLASILTKLRLPDVDEEDDAPRVDASGRKKPMSRQESARKAAAARWNTRGA